MDEVKLTVAARSDVGRVRTNNEDAFTVVDLSSGDRLETGPNGRALDVRDKGVLLALSDGMGGHQAGEVASALVLDSLRSSMQTNELSGRIEQKIEDAVRRANQDVARAAQAENKHGMGATLTAVFVCGAEAYVAEVGDSRAYLLRTGRLRQITRDQSLVQMLVDHGVLSPEDAKNSPQKNVILQAMGLAEDVRVAIGRLKLRRGDRILVCSDGLTNSVPDAELRDVLGRGDPEVACDNLIALGNERGGEDNLTAIVAQLDGLGLEPPRPAESVTATFEVLKAFGEEPPRADPAPAEPTGAAPTSDGQAPAPSMSQDGSLEARLAREVAPRPRLPTAVLAVLAATLLLAAYLVARWMNH